jgi:pimeloyl-ACP methyl ester carboxylesterase
MPVFTTPTGRQIAHEHIAGHGPTVVFCGGFRSDMTGTKAEDLALWARGSGRSFLRFDYSGHGASSGKFLDGCIGDWAADARHLIEGVTTGPLVLVGSSMGGWIALLLARGLGARVKGMVGIAAAPDFTEDSMWASFDDGQRRALMTVGQVSLPSDYSPDPYVITRRLIEDGRAHLVLRAPLDLPFPVRLLQGTADTDVPVSVALRLLDHATGPDLRLMIVKDADHRFSTPPCLAIIRQALAEVSGEINA